MLLTRPCASGAAAARYLESDKVALDLSAATHRSRRMTVTPMRSTRLAARDAALQLACYTMSAMPVQTSGLLDVGASSQRGMGRGCFRQGSLDGAAEVERLARKAILSAADHGYGKRSI